MKFSNKVKALVLAAVVAVSGATPAHAVDLAGSGASFVVPLVEACKAGFAKKTGHSFVYTSTGSGTCLLYTSPSPRDRQKSRMPSSA